MARPIDHLVLPVTTLTLARSRLTGLGFTVAPDGVHPFGTGNCCVFFRNGTYLEPITFVDRNAADQAAAHGVTFVTRLKRFTERRGEGFAMLALRSDDAERDARELDGAGPLFPFSREATLPDGSIQEIGVVLAFAAEADAPDASLFLCQRINADALWSEPLVSHPNGTEGVSGVTAVADDPSTFRDLLASVTASADLNTTADSLEVRSGGTHLSVLTRRKFASRYGVDPPNARRGLLFAAIDFKVADLDRAIGYAGSTASRHGSHIVVPASAGLCAVLAFGTD